jgi:signal transduction histidine kinase
MGLVAALRWYAEQFSESSRIKARLDIPRNFGRLPRTFEIAVFRIVEEALTNVRRHSKSSSVTILLTRSANELLLELRDQGVGISAVRNPKGLGIVGMQERARELGGSLTVKSDGVGTQILARLPLPKDGEKK